MIGQTNILNYFKSHTLNNLPKTNLLIGDDGCGKHTLIDELSKFYNVDVADITSVISNELIDEIYLCALRKFYIINLNEIDIKKQNMILKFVEEPGELIYIFLISSSENIVLNTIKNRCNIIKFDNYSEEELSQFLPSEDKKDILLELCNTPGQLKMININTVDEYKLLSDKIVSSITNTKLGYFMTMIDRFNTDNNFDKLDFKIFLRYFSNYIIDTQINKLYNVVDMYYNRTFTPRIDKTQLISSFIYDLFEEVNK